MKNALTFLLSSTQSNVLISTSSNSSPIPDFLNLSRLFLSSSRSPAMLTPRSTLFFSAKGETFSGLRCVSKQILNTCTKQGWVLKPKTDLSFIYYALGTGKANNKERYQQFKTTTIVLPIKCIMSPIPEEKVMKMKRKCCFVFLTSCFTDLLQRICKLQLGLYLRSKLLHFLPAFCVLAPGNAILKMNPSLIILF